VRVSAKDDGSLGNGYTVPGEPKQSAWGESNLAKLDNTPPTGEATASPTTPTNGDVEITLTVGDVGAGATGVAGVVSLNGLTVTEDNGVYKTTVEVNGTYTFTVTDMVDNNREVAIPIDNIDKLPPVVTYTANAEVVYAGASIEIEL